MSFLLCCVSGNVSCDSSRFYRADRQTKVKTLLGLQAIFMQAIFIQGVSYVSERFYRTQKSFLVGKKSTPRV